MFKSYYILYSFVKVKVSWQSIPIHSNQTDFIVILRVNRKRHIKLFANFYKG